MMGQRSGKQDRLFYSFNLDEHVPADHMLRSIDRYLDLTDLHQHLEAYYSHTGRPSVDPELMIRMLIVGYCFGIRSERRLCDEVHLNLAYRQRRVFQHNRPKAAVRSSAAWCHKRSSERTYSITWSTLTSNVGGMVTPMALAVLRLSARWKVRGASKGRSATLAPCSSRSAYSAAR